MKTKFSAITMLIALVLLTLACKKKDTIEEPKKFEMYSNQVVLDWNVTAYDAMGGIAYQHSLLASRLNAIVHIAMHDALNAVANHYKTYALIEKNENADPIAAMASAAYEVLVVSTPDKKALLDERLAASLSKVEEGKAKTDGILLGKKAAAAILELRKDDNALANPVGIVAPSNQAGVYQPVPPFDFVFAPHWATMKPFALQKPEQFRMEAMPALNSQAYTDAFNEVKQIGQKNSTIRTAEQTGVAKYWYEFSESGWNRVARVVAADRKLSLLTTARLFALVDMAMADAYTAGWDAKFHHNFWRPFTAIRGAANDGNSNTTADANWEPSEVTPPVHDYPSTHSALGNAAASVLAGVLGDKVTFSMTSTSGVAPYQTRTFNSFSQAANENAESRVLAGIHFRFSCVKGQEMGTKIGKWVLDNALKTKDKS
jgi:PAP2 superfamily